MGCIEASGPAAMPAVLAAVASELSLAGGQCARLDGALGQLLAAAPPDQRRAVMQELHTVDLLSQQIAALAGFVGRLSDAAASCPAVDLGEALQTITLAEVAERIRRGVGQGGEAAPSADEEVDFF